VTTDVKETWMVFRIYNSIGINTESANQNSTIIQKSGVIIKR